MDYISVGRVEDFAPLTRRFFSDGRQEIAVFRVADEFYAYLNMCPHQGGPACRGAIMPKVLEPLDEDGGSLGRTFSDDEHHIVCPWHGFEFDMKTGKHPGDPTMKLKSFPVRVENGEIYVDL